jgi:hypothetical protein
MDEKQLHPYQTEANCWKLPHLLKLFLFPFLLLIFQAMIAIKIK